MSGHIRRRWPQSGGKARGGRRPVLEFLEDRLAPAAPVILGFVQPMAGLYGTASAVATDAASNVYVTGSYRGTTDLGGISLTAPNGGNEDAFVARYSSAGALMWVRDLGYGALTTQGKAIAVDGQGNVYTTGVFVGSGDFDPGSGTSLLTTLPSTSTAYVSKLDAAGNFVFAAQIGAGGSSSGTGLALDGQGNVCTTGYFNGTGDFDPGSGTYLLTCTDSSGNAYVSKLDAAGNFLFAKKLGAGSYTQGADIAVDGSNNIYTAGWFSGTGNFDPNGSFPLTSGNGANGYLSKLDSAGNFVYARQVGGSLTAIAVDGSGDVYTTGSAAGTPIALVAKLDAAGNSVFSVQLGAGCTQVSGTGIALDGHGNVYTIGDFQGTGDFDPGPGTVNLSSGPWDFLSSKPQFPTSAYVSKLDAAGNFVFAEQPATYADTVASSGFSTFGYGIALDNNGAISSVGAFTGTKDFDPNGTLLRKSSGSRDGFLVQWVPAPATGFILAPDRSLWETTPVGTFVISPAGTILSESTAGTGASGVSAFAVPSDRSLWVYDKGNWALLSPGGTILSASAVRDGSGNDVVYAITADTNLWEHSPAIPGGWMIVSTGSFGSVSAGLSGSGAAVAYGVLSDSSLWEYNPAFANPGHWQILSPAGTILSASAGAHDDVFALASDHSLWEFAHGAWAILSPADTILSMQAGTSAAGTDVVFALASDHSLWQNAAGAWALLSPAGTIAAVDYTQRDAVFVSASDRSFWEYDPAAGWTHLFPWMTA
jgi:hypothetical protein